MKLKFYLIGMTLLAVVSDTMLHPFFPQFFQGNFGLADSRSIGLYLAASCLTIMFAFPFWAYLAKRIHELHLLVYTQLAAGVLSIYCYQTHSLTAFWVVSLTMIWFKGSYLLIYPYIMRLVGKDEHTSTVGTLSVVVHFGGIAGALLGGTAIQSLPPTAIYLIMAVSDFIQMAICLYLLQKYGLQQTVKANTNTRNHATRWLPGYVWKLGLTTLVFYFSSYLVRPFFSVYWEQLSGVDNQIVSGLVFAIPGFLALIALWLDTRVGNKVPTAILPALVICLCGLCLQAAAIPSAIIVGRVIYGWGLYHLFVKFDVLLFRKSSPEHYASDYSKVHFFQNLGVLIASFSAGYLVDAFGLRVPFYGAILGFIGTLVLFVLCFSQAHLPKPYVSKILKKYFYEQ